MPAKVTPVPGPKARSFARSHTVPFSDTPVTYTWTAQPALCIVADGLGHTPFTLDNASWSPKEGIIDVNGKTVIAPRSQDTLEMARFVASDGNMYVMGWHDDQAVQANIGGFIDEIVVPTIITGIDDAAAVPVGPPPISLGGTLDGIDGAICLSGNIIVLVNDGTVRTSGGGWASSGTVSNYFNTAAFVTTGSYFGTEPTVFGWDRAEVVGSFRGATSIRYAQSGTIYPTVDYNYNYMAETPANTPYGFVDSGITWRVQDAFFNFDRQKGIVGILDGGDMIVDAQLQGAPSYFFHALVRLPHTGYNPASPHSSDPSVFRNLSNGTSGLLAEGTNHLPSPVTQVGGQDAVYFLRPGFANGKQYTVGQRAVSSSVPAAPGLGINNDVLDTTFIPDLWEFNGTTGALTYLGEFSQSVFVDTIRDTGITADIRDIAYADDGAGNVLIALRFASQQQHAWTIHAYKWDGATLSWAGYVYDATGGTFFNVPDRRGEGSGLIRFGKTLAYTLTPVTRAPVTGPGSQVHVPATSKGSKVRTPGTLTHILF